MPAIVHFVKARLEEGEKPLLAKFDRLLAAADPFAGLKPGALVAIKTHLGEKGNKGHVPPAFIAAVGRRVKDRGGKPFVAETSTLYVGRRSNAVDHLNLAYEHGFGPTKIGMPIVMADGLSGQSQVAVRIGGVHHDAVNVAADVPFYDYLVGIAHVTGHMCSGMGACLKNLGMGLSSRAGKLSQHSAVKPSVAPDACVMCGACFRYCPADAIVEADGRARIVPEACIGCGECLSVCKAHAVKFAWDQDSKDLQELMAEHALGVVRPLTGRHLFANFAWKITENCDCMAKDDPAVCPDLGILASTDPVALDKATLDLLTGANAGDIFHRLTPAIDALVQVRHGERIGLGTADYALNEIA